MRKLKQLAGYGNERLGLTMIAASLLAIALIIVMHLWNEKSVQTDQIRTQGTGLTRALAGLPYEQLVSPESQHGLLRTVFQSQNDPNFAYAAIVDSRNQPVSVATAPGIIVPSMTWPDKPVGWLSDRSTTTANGDEVIEFFAPLYVNGTIDAYLRLGYILPKFGDEIHQLPFFATLSLIVFLLTPMFYLLVRHEIRPLRQASSNIADLIENEQFRGIELRASGEFSNFLERFNNFVELAKNRITELENEQERLQTSKKLISYSKSRIENVLETIPEAILILDQTGKISFANKRVETLLGVARVDVIEGSFGDWCSEPKLREAIASFAEQRGAGYLSDTVRVDLSDMQGRKLAVNSYPLFSPGDSNTIHGSIIIIRDVTKDADKQRRHGEFVSHVAHELKTPLNTLALYAESLISEDADEPKIRIESANIMHDEVQRLAGLIDNLLNITKIENGDIAVERGRLRLGEFLEDTFGIASRGEDARSLTFDIDLPPDISPILADKDLLRIAVNNLLTNAVKYSEPGGVVSLICEDTDNTIRIKIRDTGIGIGAADQEKIFDRFYRSQNEDTRARAGHGLGLSLAQDIVQLHNGTLTVNSTPGEGSEFVIEIWKESGLLKQAI